MGNYAGMTVNERLAVSGLMNEFDKAKQRKDKEKLIEILTIVNVDKNSIKSILVSFGLE